MDICALCRKPGTKNNTLTRHHSRGRKKGRDETEFVMRVHQFACHPFADFVTQLYQQAGMEDELNPNIIVYAYNRMIGLRHSDGYVLHPMRS